MLKYKQQIIKRYRLFKGGNTMATSSIYNKIIIESDEAMDKLINELENKNNKNHTPKINVQNELKKGKEILEKI